MQVAVKNKTQKDATNASSTNNNQNTNSASVLDTNANTNTEATVQQFSLPSWANVDLKNPSWDIFIVLFFVVASLLYGLSLGRDRIIIILVSIYMALAVVHALPDFVLKITLNQQVAFQITAFISLFVVLFFLISRSALMRTLGNSASDDGTWLQTMVFSLLHVGLLICITMSFLPTDILSKFAPLTQHIFTGEWPTFGWIAAPMVAMIIFGSRKRHDED